MNIPAYDLNLDVPLVPSKRFGRALLALHILVFFVLSQAHLPLVLKLGGLMAFIAHAFWVLRFWRTLRELNGLQVRGGRLGVVVAGKLKGAAMHKPALVTRYLLVVYIKLDDRKIALPIFGDSGCAEDLRRLVVWLRCGG